jgi:outer membrane receptor protein involved in Fe transport
VPLNDPFGGWVFWGRVPSESIAEVEIVRGPAGDLYGTAAVGGVIAVRSFDSDSIAARADVSYGNEHSPNISAFASGRIFRPYNASFGFESFRTDGSVPTAPEFRGLVDTAAGVRRTSATPRVGRLVGKGSVFLSGDFYRESRTNGSPLQTNDTRLNNLTLGGDLEWRKRGTLTLRLFGGNEIYHQSFSSIAGDRNSESLTRLQSVPSRIIGVRCLWSGYAGRGLYYAGDEARDIRGRSDETGFAAGRANVRTSAGGREVTTALFAGGVYYLTDRLSVSGGLRFDNWQNLAGFSDSRSLLNLTATHTRFSDRTQSRLSPRASLLFRASRHISFAGTFATGFRQPTLNELYRSFRVGNILTLANEDLRAERAWDLEGAAIVNAMSGRLYLRTGPFCTRVDDPVANVTLIVTPMLITRQRQNLGRTRTCGWEGDVDVRPTSSITLSGGFLVASPRVIIGTTPDLNGLLLPQVPRRTFTLQARYSRPRGMDLSAQMRSSSSQFEDDQNQLVLDGYTAVDAFVSYYLGKWATVYVAGENLFDSRIEAGRTPVLTLAQPRAFRLGIRLRFGE